MEDEVNRVVHLPDRTSWGYAPVAAGRWGLERAMADERPTTLRNEIPALSALKLRLLRLTIKKSVL